MKKMMIKHNIRIKVKYNNKTEIKGQAQIHRLKIQLIGTYWNA